MYRAACVARVCSARTPLPIHARPFAAVGSFLPARALATTTLTRPADRHARDNRATLVHTALASMSRPATTDMMGIAAPRRALSSQTPQTPQTKSTESVVVAADQQQQSRDDQRATSGEEEELPRGWWARWLHEHPMPPRWSREWYLEMALIFTVFGVTGSSSMYFVKPLVKVVLGIDGTLMEGPWSYRLVCLGVLMPAYSMMLVTFGTIAGRHHYFRRQALKMWGRLLPLHKIGITSKPPPPPRTAITQTKPPAP